MWISIERCTLPEVDNIPGTLTDRLLLLLHGLRVGVLGNMHSLTTVGADCRILSP